MTTDKKIKEMIARMILKDNYWGYLFSRIRRIPSETLPSIMGVVVDKDATISLHYQPKLVDNTEEKYLEKVIEHEGMHLLNKHLQRLLKILAVERNKSMKRVKMDIWNTASDCAANEQAGLIDDLIIAEKKWPLQLPKNHNLEAPNISEQYYYTLLKRAKINKIKINVRGEGEGKDGGKGFDDHSGWTKGSMEGGSDPNVIARKMEEYLREIVRDSIKNFSNKRGTLPSNIAELIDKFMKPTVIPYYQMIRKLVIGSRLSKFVKCYTRINRKRTYLFSISDDMIPAISPFPGRKSDYSFKINLLIDTSGSMSCKDIQEALKSIKDIIENDRDCRVHVIENDACIQREYDVKRIKDIKFDVHGRGGTTLLPGIDRCRELSADITLAFTDGYCENLNSVNIRRFPKKLIWVITEGGDASTVNRTGRVVHLNK